MPAPPLAPRQVEVNRIRRVAVRAERAAGKTKVPRVGPANHRSRCTAHDGLVTGELRTVLEFRPHRAKEPKP